MTNQGFTVYKDDPKCDPVVRTLDRLTAANKSKLGATADYEGIVNNAHLDRIPDSRPTYWLADRTAASQFKPNTQPLIKTATALQTMRFEPLKYIVPGLIVEGCVLLAGKPKVGKSWLALDFGIAVAAHRYCLGDRKCEQGSVLHLALEDGDRRLQRRIGKLLPTFGSEWPATFHYATEWPRADRGGVEKIEQWCEENPDARLVVIDVLAKFRALSRNKSNAYEQDYAALSKLQELATRRSITILVVHHTRKGDSEDPVEEISGTLGLAGAADAFLVLKRAACGVTLTGRGRDTEDLDFAIQFNRDTCRWTILGSTAEIQRSKERGSILAALQNAGGELSVKEIMAATDLHNRNAVDILLFKMRQAGEVERPRRGFYRLPTDTGKIKQKERLIDKEPDSIEENGDLSNLSDLSGQTE
jgi:AAA domain